MGNGAQRAHVLLIDDSPAVFTVFQRFLEAEGYRVTTSHTLLSRTRVLAVAPDVLVLELVTPDRVDLEQDYLEALHRDPQTCGIPVVLCTTASWRVCEPSMAAYLERLGVHVLLKPCRPAELIAAVADALHLSDAADGEQTGLDDMPGGAQRPPVRPLAARGP